jgi:hypothetical protein
MLVLRFPIPIFDDLPDVRRIDFAARAERAGLE